MTSHSVPVPSAPLGFSVTASDCGHRMNLARFDLVSIRLAVLCDELGGLAGAARIAHMSKSNASYRLSELELSLGTPLFVRDHRGLRPTEAGAIFIRHARSILLEVSRLGDQLAPFTVTVATHPS